MDRHAATARVAGWTERLLERLPRGRSLEADVFGARHRGILVLLWLHAIALPLLSLAYGDPLLHALAHGAALAALALAAAGLRGCLSRAVTASFGLLTASALLVHITGGVTEAHFHFFVMISVVTLYEDWRTFLLAFAYVVIHHGLMGTVLPHAVFDHGDATLAPWKWAGIHGGFVLAAGVANVVAWRANETATEQRTRVERDRADDAQRRLAALVEATEDAVISKTPRGIVTSWNAGAERLFGRTAEEMIGRSIMAIVPSELEEEEYELMTRVVTERRVDSYETSRLHADGREIDVSLAVSLVPDLAGGEPGLVAIARDITDRKRVERERRAEAARFQELALADHLTGLGNARQFHDSLDREIARGARDGKAFSVLMFDLDGFKSVNDAKGHAEGDRVLRLFADLMLAGGRGVDVACRLGGDEFGLILPSGERAGAVGVAERIRAGLQAARTDVDVSFGVAVWPDDAAQKDELIVRADTGMYAAKAVRPARGRGEQVRVHAPGSAVDGHAAIQRLLDMARRHLDMDVALLGEFDAGDEVVRDLAGDGDAFGVSVRDRIPLDDTYCQRMVDGRLTSIVHDAARDERVGDLAITRQAGIGAYIGVPLRLPAGELYGVLCCLRKDPDHELDERDVSFLKMLAGIAGEQLERSRIEHVAERLRNEATGIDALLSRAGGTR